MSTEASPEEPQGNPQEEQPVQTEAPYTTTPLTSIGAGREDGCDQKWLEIEAVYKSEKGWQSPG